MGNGSSNRTDGGARAVGDSSPALRFDVGWQWRGEDEPRGDGDVTVKVTGVRAARGGEVTEKEKRAGAIDGGDVTGKVMGAGEPSGRGVRLEGPNWDRCLSSHREPAVSAMVPVSGSITGRLGVFGPDSH